MAVPLTTLGPAQSANAFHEIAIDPVAFKMISGTDPEAVGFTQVAGIGNDFSFMRDTNQILTTGYKAPSGGANWNHDKLGQLTA
jgi:hypothetical protein